MTVAVVGGGAIGTSVAFHLARRGADVRLFERDGVASGSTGRAHGGVRYLFDHPLNVAMMAGNLRFFENFESEVGVDVEFDQTGYCFLFRNERVERVWRERLPRYREHGLPAEVLDPDGVTGLFEPVDASGIRGALFGPRCGFVDPHSVAHAFADRARELGAAIETGVEVRDVLVEGGRVRGVETDVGRIEADHVVDAAGPWAGRVAEMAGVDLPLSFIRSGMLVADIGERVSSPFVIDEGVGGRFRAEGNGELLVGLHQRGLDGPDHARRVTAEDRLDALGDAAAIAPVIEGLEVINEWTGTLSYTEDGHPVVGPAGPSGFLVATGFSGHGLMMAPLVGQALSDLILDGRTDAFDVDALSLSRFDRPPEERIEPESKSTSSRYE